MIGRALFKLLAGPLVEQITGVFKAYQGRKATEAEMRAEVQQAVLSCFNDISDKQARTIVAEAQGEDWLQRNWRPVTALSFTFIVFFYALLMPVAVDWFGAPPVRIGDILLGWVIQGVLFCLGGYIGGRSIEKIVREIVSGKALK